MWKAYILLF